MIGQEDFFTTTPRCNDRFLANVAYHFRQSRACAGIASRHSRRISEANEEGSESIVVRDFT